MTLPLDPHTIEVAAAALEADKIKTASADSGGGYAFNRTLDRAIKIIRSLATSPLQAPAPGEGQPEQIERMAIALWDFERKLPNARKAYPSWESQMPEFQEHTRNRVRAMLSASPPPSGGGWREIEWAELERLAADSRVSSELIGMRVRNVINARLCKG